MAYPSKSLRKSVWAETTEHRGRYLLAFVLSGLPLAIGTIWPSLTHQTIPEWLADNGWPKLRTLVIVWVAVALVIAIVIVVRSIQAVRKPKTELDPETRNYLIERLREFIREASEIDRQDTLTQLTSGFTFRGKVEHFLSLHFTEEHVNRFQDRGLYALEETIGELLGVNTPPKQLPNESRTTEQNLLEHTRSAESAAQSAGVAASVAESKAESVATRVERDQSTQNAMLDIAFEPSRPFIMDHSGGRLYRIGVTSSVNAIVRVMVEKAILDGQTIPNLNLRITGDLTGLETEKELHEGVPVYWDVVEKFSHGGGIQLRHVMPNLPHELGTKSTFRIIASSNKGPLSAKWASAEIDSNNELQFKLSSTEPPTIIQRADLQFLKPKVIPVFQDVDKVFHEQRYDYQLASENPHAAIIPLINEMPESSIAPSLRYVRAALSFFSHEGDDEGTLRIPESIWLDRYKGHVSIDAGRIEKLIIAVQYKNGVVNVMKFGEERHRTYEGTYVFDPGWERLQEPEYRVWVHVIKGYKNAELLLTDEFILKLKPEFTIERKEKGGESS